MVDRLLLVLAFFSTLGCGLVGGIFFAFSTFVMSALARLPPSQGIAAMQSINTVVINVWFLAVFFGTAAACGILASSSLFVWHPPNSVYLLLGSLVYLIGTVLVTIAFNVPLNEQLATVNASSADGASQWASYITSWTNWNHVRTAAALTAAALLALALCSARRMIKV